MEMLSRLFTFTDYDINDVLELQFYNAQFFEDFGLFKKGIGYGCITVCFMYGIIKCWDNVSEVEFEQKFNIHPEVKD